LGNSYLNPANGGCFAYDGHAASDSCSTNKVDWISNSDVKFDLRMVHVEYDSSSKRWHTVDLFVDASGKDDISPLSNYNVAYTVEALFYA